ncbi:conserved hypothetical protein [delta proteobacterium NaphS2]|nr:conserved hypothetical protein [delta proteobacterium NaphS2]
MKLSRFGGVEITLEKSGYKISLNNRINNIVELDKIKIYYPFFKSIRGHNSTLMAEKEWIIGYLLLCDVVVISPREFLLSANIKPNIKEVLKNNLLIDLFNTNRIITSSTDESICDLRGLIEHYQPSIKSSKNFFKMNVYYRDVEFQKSIHSEYLKNHISNVYYYDQREKDYFLRYLNDNPDQPQIEREIKSLKKDLHPAAFERLMIESKNGYFLGGARGNDCIMPPMGPKETFPIYNTFYSKSILRIFIEKFQKQLKRNIFECSPDMFIQVHNE